jgi:hypothetical protein
MRTIETSRLYKLAEYNNISFKDSYTFELPEGKELNDELVNQIYYLQQINCEMNYMKYVLLHQRVSKAPSLDDAIILLEDEKLSTTKSILDLLKGD